MVYMIRPSEVMLLSRPARSLVGFLDEASAVRYLTSMCVWPDNSAVTAAARWKEARALVQPISCLPGVPDVQEIPPRYDKYLRDVTQYPRFAELAGEGASFKLVEIDPILCFQLHVLDDVVEGFSTKGGAQSLREHLKLCLPSRVQPTPMTIKEEPDGIAIESLDLNLHLLGDAKRTKPPALGGHLTSFLWGRAFPMVHVVRYNGRCYMKNGYHRAVSLRKAGATHVPCLFTEVTSYQQMRANQPGLFGQQVLSSALPPTIGHLASAMAYPVALREYKRVIRITAVQSEISLDP